MNSMLRRAASRRLLAACAAAALTLAAGAAHAQLSTSTVIGALPEAGAGATVTAREVDTGFVTHVATGQGGAFTISGLRPGRYEITIAEKNGQTRTETIVVQVGETATISFDSATQVREVRVVGRRTNEVKTSEVATNVSRAQIENLPQFNRNFLNFAELAPGVRLSGDQYRQVFYGTGQGPDGSSLQPNQVNVFIDGVSLKSEIQQGGLVGQDSSRGNPFSQLAVQEFRVSTENFKAEYEQASNTIITAVTKSGTNEFHGEVFGLYSNKDMQDTDFITREQHGKKPEYEKEQYGVSLGGPIIKDKLQFFVAYEGRDENRAANVVPGTPPANSGITFDPQQYAGTVYSPFHEDLLFGKLTWHVDDFQTVDFSGSYRTESEIRRFGGQSVGDQAQANDNTVTTWMIEDKLRGDGWLNEATLDFKDATWNPRILNPNEVGQNYFGVILLGGYSTAQDVTQRDYTFRDNVTFNPVDWNGTHVFKIGAKVSRQSYQVANGQNTNPEFDYNYNPSQGEDFSQPFQAVYGTGTPHLNAHNTELGVFAQDDWRLTSQWTLNLGVRWDYESNANNNGYVTPANAVTALQYLQTQLDTMPGNHFNANDYISNGHNRPAFLGAFQPRVGVSYDVFNNQRTVLFAGAGRYYDRNIFRNAAEEDMKRQFALRTFQFSKDGLPRNGQPTIKWDPSYLSKAGLDALIASNLAPDGELRAMRNDQPPPYTDQFSAGVRQKIGAWQTALTLTHQETKHLIGYYPANRSPTHPPGGFYQYIPLPGFGNVVASSADGASKYDALFLTAEKPYTKASKWGATITYTHVFQSKQKGYEFNFDFPNIAGDPYVPNAGDERDHLVATGMVSLPWGFMGSGVLTYSSGQPFYFVNADAGWDPGSLKEGDFYHLPSYTQLDLRLSKTFKLPYGNLELLIEALNITNADIPGGTSSCCFTTDPSFGKVTSIGGPPRTFQVGGNFRF
jgi:outer membrane receptor protein involved in Fe transport